MLTKPRAEVLYLGRHPPLKKLGFLHGPGCTETTLAMCSLTQGFDLIVSQQDKGENYHQSYCNPYGSLLPVNAFPNGESTDCGDSGEVQEDSVFSGGRDTSSCLGPGQLLSENDTTPTQPMSTSSHCCWWCDRREVGMDFDMRELSLEMEIKRGITFTLLFLGL